MAKPKLSFANSFKIKAGNHGVGSTFQFPKNEVYVKRWVDYTSKYGLGYLLSNGSTGIFFNDSSKIVLSPKGT